jgi:hypothetical protein
MVVIDHLQALLQMQLQSQCSCNVTLGAQSMQKVTCSRAYQCNTRVLAPTQLTLVAHSMHTTTTRCHLNMHSLRTCSDTSRFNPAHLTHDACSP